MHRRIVPLAADSCCILLTDKNGNEALSLFEGGEMCAPVAISSGEVRSSAVPKKLGVVTMASWKSRWLLFIYPQGRVNVLEYTPNSLVLISTFDCPVNTSAAIVLDDEVDDCALVVFGTDEGARASRIHIARLTFSSESLSVKPLHSWKCPGGVSSFAMLSSGHLAVGYTSREGVGVFNPYSFDDRSSPALGMRQRPGFNTSANQDAPSEHTDPQQALKTEIRSLITGDGVPVWVATKAKQLITLTRCGTLRCYSEDEVEIPKSVIFLGFDCTGLRTIPANDGIVICGWMGDTALVDFETGQVARFTRKHETARVDDFALSVSSDSRVLLIQTDADNESRINVFDFGKAALLGSCKRIDLLNARNSDDEIDNDDELVFVGADENYGVLSNDMLEEDTGTISVNSASMKAMLKDAWDLMIEEATEKDVS